MFRTRETIANHTTWLNIRNHGIWRTQPPFCHMLTLTTHRLLRTKSLMWIFLFNSKNHSNYKLLLVISNCPKCHLPPSVIMMSKRLVIFSSLSNVCIVLFPSRLATIRFEVHRCIIHLSRSLALFISLRGRSVSRTVPCGVDV